MVASRDRPFECLKISHVADFQSSETELMIGMTTNTAIITKNPIQVEALSCQII